MLFRAVVVAAAIATAAMLALAGCGLPSQNSLETVTTTVRVTVTPPAPPGQPKTAFGDGTYQVGVDIAPGTYRSAGGVMCYWKRLGSLNASDIIDNNDSPGPQVVGIQP